jgi:TolA-binding protein
LYARTGRLGLADAQVAQKKYDNAITIYTEMSRDTTSQMPVDGVLMQLGRACALAGRKEEAVRAFTRVTEEFPTSLYTADAKRELEDIRKS